MPQLDTNRTYIEFLLEKDKNYSLKTIYEEQENSDLLKEFSSSMIESETSLGEVVELLKSNDVPLPDLRYLNDTHEDKIYHLGLSAYAYMFIQRKIEELKKKEEKLNTQSIEVEELGVLEDIEVFKSELVDIRTKINEYTTLSEERYGSVLKDTSLVDAFIRGEGAENSASQGVSDEQKKEAISLLRDMVVGGEKSDTSVSAFIEKIKISIDRVDALISKCSIVIEGHDVSVEIENMEINSIFLRNKYRPTY